MEPTVSAGTEASKENPGGLKRLLAMALRVPLLTKRRIGLAFAVAGLADLVQWIFAAATMMPLWFDDAVDVGALFLLWRLLGFHIVLLPAFLAEIIPFGVELLPTWLAATAWLVRQRGREQNLVAGGAASGGREAPPPA